mmetsp:Transcript_15510/g.51995  ORF Transcript_15510/g.51995 Transcript_15510/m.51995 type:complete len:234 (+) Transcript_15510:3488-4189(+)
MYMRKLHQDKTRSPTSTVKKTLKMSSKAKITLNQTDLICSNPLGHWMSLLTVHSGLQQERLAGNLVGTGAPEKWSMQLLAALITMQDRMNTSAYGTGSIRAYSEKFVSLSSTSLLYLRRTFRTSTLFTVESTPSSRSSVISAEELAPHGSLPPLFVSSPSTLSSGSSCTSLLSAYIRKRHTSGPHVIAISLSLAIFSIALGILLPHSSTLLGYRNILLRACESGFRTSWFCAI